jgi:hypothetical protein
MGTVLATGLLVIAIPMTAVALRVTRNLLPVVEIPVETPAASPYDTTAA